MARLQAVLLLLVCGLVTLAAAFSKEDHDIFRLRDAVELAEGEGATFYSFLGVPPSATQEDLKRANRKRSKQLHPDRAVPSILNARYKPTSKTTKPGKKPSVQVKKGPSKREREIVTKEATERYQRLSVVAEILMTPSRERYDHFMKNGFPRWRGTGYYYARFRPGLGSVLFGLLVVFGGAAHYGALYLSWKRQREFVERYITHARRTAWGNDGGIPGVPDITNGTISGAALEDGDIPEGGVALNRRQKRMQEKEKGAKKKDGFRTPRSARNRNISAPMDAEMISGPQGTKKKVIAENGKVLIVDSVGNVYLEEKTAEGDTHEFLLDPEEIPKPTMSQTVLFRLPIWAYDQTVGRALGKKRDEVLLDGEELTIDPEEDSEEVLDTATSINANGETRKRKAKAKAL